MSAREEGLREFAHWVAVGRAYNGSNHERGQSLYNECLNAVLPTWVEEFIVEHPATPAEVGTRKVEPEMMPTAGGWACKRCGDAPHDCGEPECYYPCPTTPGCVGDARYDSPDRRHVTGCQHEPAEPDAGDVGEGLTDAERAAIAGARWADDGADAGHMARFNAVERIVAVRERKAAEQALRDVADHERANWSSWLDGWLSAVGPMPPTVEQVADALRSGPRPFGVASNDEIAGDE